MLLTAGGWFDCAGGIQAPISAPEEEFPSLGAAAVFKETKKDKKKKQTMSLGDFMASGGTGSRRGMDDPIMDLPTAPRGRREGEEDTGPSLGGGFRGYGTSFDPFSGRCVDVP